MLGIIRELHPMELARLTTDDAIAAVAVRVHFASMSVRMTRILKCYFRYIKWTAQA